MATQQKTKYKGGDTVWYTPADPAAPVPPPSSPYPWECLVDSVYGEGDKEGTYAVHTKDGKHSFDAQEAELADKKVSRREAREAKAKAPAAEASAEASAAEAKNAPHRRHH